MTIQRPRRVAQLEAVQPAAPQPAAAAGPRKVVAVVKPDAQNVHDSTLVRHLRHSLDQLPKPPGDEAEQLRRVRGYLKSEPPTDESTRALQTIDRIKSHTGCRIAGACQGVGRKENGDPTAPPCFQEMAVPPDEGGDHVTVSCPLLRDEVDRMPAQAAGSAGTDGVVLAPSPKAFTPHTLTA